MSIARDANSRTLQIEKRYRNETIAVSKSLLTNQMMLIFNFFLISSNLYVCLFVSNLDDLV